TLRRVATTSSRRVICASLKPSGMHSSRKLQLEQATLNACGVIWMGRAVASGSPGAAATVGRLAVWATVRGVGAADICQIIADVFARPLVKSLTNVKDCTLALGHSAVIR